MYIVQYTMTYARNIYVSQKMYLNYDLFKVIMERNEPLIHKLCLYIYYTLYTLYCITDLYSFVRANGLTNKLIRIRIRGAIFSKKCPF